MNFHNYDGFLIFCLVNNGHLTASDVFAIAGTCKENREWVISYWRKNWPLNRPVKCISCVERADPGWCHEAAKSFLDFSIKKTDLVAWKFTIDVLEYPYIWCDLTRCMENSEAVDYLFSHPSYTRRSEKEQREIKELGFARAMNEGNVEMLDYYHKGLGIVSGLHLSGNSFDYIRRNQTQILEYLVNCNWGSEYCKERSDEALDARKRKREYSSKVAVKRRA